METTHQKKPCTNFLEKDTYYSITLNASDKYQYVGKSSKDRMALFRANYYAILIGMEDTNYLLYTEISEPRNVNSTIGPRLHLHGFIKFKTNSAIKEFLLSTHYKLNRLGIVDMDTCEDQDYWRSYCKKQQHIVMEKPFTNMAPPAEK